MEGFTESLDARGRPVGEIGKSAGFDLALVAEGFAQEDGRCRGAIGDGDDVHAYISMVITPLCEAECMVYLKNEGGRSVGTQYRPSRSIATDFTGPPRQ